jgi:multidrug efflux system outer membrane protein
MANKPLGRYLTLLLLLLVAAGCASVPPRGEVVPQLPAPEAFEGAPAAPAPAPFWQRFGDSDLEALVAEALEKNDDLRLAEARIAEAQALLGIARADLFPEIGAQLGASRSDPGVDSPPDMQDATDKYSLQGTISYEIDLWGRIRALRGAAAETLAASVYDREAAELSVAANVSRVWLGHRVTAAQLAAARSTLKSFGEALGLQKDRFEAGVIDDLQLQQATAEEAAALATVKTLELSYLRERHALAVLVGKDPAEIDGDTLPRPEATQSAGVPAIPEVPPGLPSELLTRRPDVKAEEARLMAAAGNLAAARTAYLPSLTLTGNLGSETRSLGDLLKSGTSIWTIGADLVQAIFAGGRFKAGIELREAQQEQLLAIYTKRVRTAFREVYDSLVAQRSLREAVAARQAELAAREKALELAGLRYDAGYVGYLEVIDSQRFLFATQQQELELRRSALQNAVDLMLALGGGWEDEAAE